MFERKDDEMFRGASFAKGDRVGPEPTFDEIAETTLQDVRLSGEMMSRRRALERAYDESLDAIYQATGQKFELGNPMRAFSVPEGPDPVPVEDLEAPIKFDAWRRALAEQHPDKRHVIRPDAPIELDAARLTQGAATRASETWDRSSKGFSAYAAWSWGNLKAAATDPVNWITAPIGGGPAGLGAKAVVWAGLKAGAANAAVEAGVQPFVQSWRAEAGLDYGVSQAAMSVAAAGAFGFGLDAGVRGLARGVRRTIGDVPVLDATGNVTGWRSPRERPLEALDLAARQRPPEDVLARAASGDLDALSEVARASKLADGDEMRGALQAAEMDRPLADVPAGVSPAEHARVMQDAIRAAAGDDLVPARVIAAAEVTASPDRVAEIFARDPLQLAADIRADPKLLGEKLPWGDPALRTAVMLSYADEALWRAVEARNVSPEVAAIVAEFVPEQGRHLELAEAVMKAKPATRDAAKAALRQALKRPTRLDIPEQPVLKISDPRGADGAQHLEQLKARHAARAEARRSERAAAPDARPAPTDAQLSMRELQAAIAEAQARVPRGVTIRSFADLKDLPEAMRLETARAEALTGKRAEGITDAETGDIWIARDAMDPRGVLHSETVHALIASGHMTEPELKMLSDVARENPGLYDRDSYVKAYENMPDGDRALMEEDAEHVYNAWKQGRQFTRRVDGNWQRIVRRISNLLERVKNLVLRRGFRLDFDALMIDIDTGRMAKRTPGSADGSGSRFALRRGYRPRPDEREMKIGVLDPTVASWLGVEARQFQIDPTYIAAKRRDHAAANGYEIAPQFETPEATREFVDATIANAHFARRRDANTWNLLRMQDDGSAHIVSIKVEPNDKGLYFVKTAFIANEADTMNGIVGTMRQFGETGFRVGGDPGAYRRFLASVSQSARTVPDREFDSIVAAFAQDVPAAAIAAEGGVRFQLRLQAASDLRADMLAASRLKDAKARQQAERVAYLDEEVRVNNERMVDQYRDSRGQPDPMKFTVFLIEGHGENVMPEGFQSVAGLEKAITNRFLARLEGMLHELGPTFLTGMSKNKARMENVIRELKGQDTGDQAAKVFAEAWRGAADDMRLEANAAGADIPSLDDWVMPQVHTREAMIAVGKDEWIRDQLNWLDVERILRENRDPAGPETLETASKHLNLAWAKLDAERIEAKQTLEDSQKLRRETLKQEIKAGREEISTQADDQLDSLMSWQASEIEQLRSIRDQLIAKGLQKEAQAVAAYNQAVAKLDAEMAVKLSLHDAMDANARADLTQELEARKADLKAVKDRALADARSLRDSKLKRAQPSQRDGVRTKYEKLKAAIEKKHLDDIAEAEADHASLTEKFERAVARKRGEKLAELEAEKDAKLADVPVVRAIGEGVMMERFKAGRSRIALEYGKEKAKIEAQQRSFSKMFESKAAKRTADLESELSAERQKKLRDIDASFREKIRVAEEERDAIIANGDPMTLGSLRKELEKIYDKIVSERRGALSPADNMAAPWDGVTANRAARGASYLDHREMRRFLHYRNADTLMAHNRKYGTGDDILGAMMGHVSQMAKEIAARKLLGSNPEREIQRLVNYGLKQAAMSHPMSLLVPQASARVGVVAGELLKAPERIRAIATEMGDLIEAIDKQRYVGRARRKVAEAKMKVLADKLKALNVERLEIMQTGEARLEGLAYADAYQQLDAAFDNLLDLERSQVLFPRRREITGRVFSGLAAEDYARSQARIIENMWDAFTGRMSAPVDVSFASGGRTLRNIGMIGKGGSMVLSSIADNFTGLMARTFVGSPAHKTFMSTLRQFRGVNAREAARAGLVAEKFLNMHGDGARAAAALKGETMSNYLADRVITLQGLEALTRAQRQGFGMDLQAMFADVAHMSWEKLGKDAAKTRRLLERYGFREKDWNAIRMGAWAQPHQVDFLSPRLVEESASTAIADRYLAMILQESDFASPQSMLRAKAVMYGKTRAGTLEGEVWRALMQFKSFTVMFYMLHMQRSMREMVEHGVVKGGAYAGGLLTALTLGGALVIQIKNIKNGKELEDMSLTNYGFWWRALLQGGGLGIFGDLIQSTTNRFGGGLISTLAGPVVGMGDDIAQILSAPVGGKMGEGARKALGYVPGASLWYVSTAYQRLVADQVQRVLDPEAYKAWRRREMAQRRDYGTGFWWRPGQTAPEFMRR